jgi:predicted GNAT family acetyltransferase
MAVTDAMIVVDNPERHRFELAREGSVAFSAYRREPGRITITHTEVPEVFRGKGVGSALVRGALDLVRASGDQLVALCPFTASYIKSHPEYQDLLEPPA